MPFQIVRNDITKVRADAIVNTANPKPVCASGTDYAIYTAAGMDELLSERRKIGEIQPGEVAVTPAFRLRAKYILHTVGPVWQDGVHGEYKILASCYRKSLLIARQLKCESIAFPLISTGVYGFPKDKALEIARTTISAFLDDFEMNVTLVVFDKKAFELSSSLVADINQFIDEKYVARQQNEEYKIRRRPEFSSFPMPSVSAPMPKPSAGSFKESADLMEPSEDLTESSADLFESAAELFEPSAGSIVSSADIFDSSADLFDSSADIFDSSADLFEPSADSFKASSEPPIRPAFRPGNSLSDVMKHMGENYQQRLLRLIDERGLTDSQVYKKANVDRKLFSKIRCNPEYTPSKRTALALAIALKLNLDETTDLLRRAGMAFSPSSRFDLIVEYCIRNQIYNIFEINEILFEYDQPLLGC